MTPPDVANVDRPKEESIMNPNSSFNYEEPQKVVEKILHTPHAFSNSVPWHGGFQKSVSVTCSCCDASKVVITDDFRLGWMCDECKDTPILVRVINKFAKTAGIL